ncbi:MAG: hypothetical protein WCK77_09510 [Verrucomicrobiota bacterium]
MKRIVYSLCVAALVIILLQFERGQQRDRDYYRDRTICYEHLKFTFYNIRDAMQENGGDLASILSTSNPNRPDLRCPATGKIYKVNPSRKLWMDGIGHETGEIAIVCPVYHVDKPISRHEYLAKTFDDKIVRLQQLPKWAKE